MTRRRVDRKGFRKIRLALGSMLGGSGSRRSTLILFLDMLTHETHSTSRSFNLVPMVSYVNTFHIPAIRDGNSYSLGQREEVRDALCICHRAEYITEDAFFLRTH